MSVQSSSLPIYLPVTFKILATFASEHIEEMITMTLLLQEVFTLRERQKVPVNEDVRFLASLDIHVCVPVKVRGLYVLIHERSKLHGSARS